MPCRSRIRASWFLCFRQETPFLVEHGILAADGLLKRDILIKVGKYLLDHCRFREIVLARRQEGIRDGSSGSVN